MAAISSGTPSAGTDVYRRMRTAGRLTNMTDCTSTHSPEGVIAKIWLAICRAFYSPRNEVQHQAEHAIETLLERVRSSA